MLPTKRSFRLGTGLAVWTWPADLAWFLIGIVGTVVAGRHLHNTLAGLRLGGVYRPQAISLDLPAHMYLISLAFSDILISLLYNILEPLAIP